MDMTTKQGLESQESVSGYQPSPDDLDYPGKLLRAREAAGSSGEAEAAAEGVGSSDSAQDSQVQHSLWYEHWHHMLSKCMPFTWKSREGRAERRLHLCAAMACASGVRLFQAELHGGVETAIWWGS